MKVLYTTLFTLLLCGIILFNQVLDNLLIMIYILAGCIIAGLCLKSLSKRATIKEIGHGLFYGSIITSFLLAAGLTYLAYALKNS